MTYQPLRNNPFPGIRSYEPDEDELFFGRERRIEELIDKLSETKFLAIVGSSGCGKSSLIRAGLIPTLLKHKVRKTNDHWKLILTHPGSDPIRNLSEAILEGSGTVSDQAIIGDLKKKLLTSGESLSKVISQVSNQEEISYLLVIDQFEELFRFRQNAQTDSSDFEAKRFVELFLAASSGSDVNISVVLSMRTDFMDDCTAFTHLNEAINRGYYLVPRMEDDEKRLAITGPLTFKGHKIAPELVERLLADVGDDPDQLPIMQHALMRTFEYWSTYKIGDEPLGMKHYEAIGTMKEALSVHCEEVYTELKLPLLQSIAEKAFKALTDFGTDSRGTRRPVKLSALCVLSEARKEDVVKVLDEFRQGGRAFLRPSYQTELDDETTIDISHESIMRVWKRLRKWVDEERNSSQLYLRLSKSAELFQMGKTGLWINPELQLALQWKDTNKPNSTWAMRYDISFDRAMEFLNYSHKQLLLEIGRKENIQKRNLKQARSFALILGAATVVSILFLVVSLNLRFKAEASRKDALEKQKMAVFESKRAEEQRREAIIQKRISEQQQQIAQQQQLITEEQRQFAVGQKQIAEVKTKEAIQQKVKAVAARQEAINARDETEIQRKEAVSQKQIAESERVKAENSEKNTQRLRMLSISRSLAVKASQLSLTVKGDLPSLLAVQAYNFNHENRGPENDPDLYQALSSVTNDQEILRGHEDAVRAIVLSDDNKILVSAGDDGKVLIWNLSAPEKAPVSLLTGQNGKNGIRSVAISSEWIVAGCFNGKILAWQRSLPQNQPRVLTAHKGVVTCLNYDIVNNRFTSAGIDGHIIQWGWKNNGFQLNRIDSVNTAINAIDYSSNQTSFIIGCSNGMIKIINTVDASKNKTISNSGVPVLSIAFGQGGKIFAAGDEKGRLRIWDNSNQAVLTNELIGWHSSGIISLAFSNDAKYISTSGFDKRIRTLSLDKGNQESYTITKHDLWIYDVIFSKDGSKVISCSADKTIRLFTAGCNLLASGADRKIKRNLSREEWEQYIGPDIPYQKTIQRLP
jgi:WD40 repeat protein/energy-coupling factor transporter ATP-binding protein EcfA2